MNQYIFYILSLKVAVLYNVYIVSTIHTLKRYVNNVCMCVMLLHMHYNYINKLTQLMWSHITINSTHLVSCPIGSYVSEFTWPAVIYIFILFNIFSASYISCWNVVCNVFHDNPDERHKPKHVGLTIKLIYIQQVLLEFWLL